MEFRELTASERAWMLKFEEQFKIYFASVPPAPPFDETNIANYKRYLAESNGSEGRAQMIAKQSYHSEYEISYRREFYKQFVIEYGDRKDYQILNHIKSFDKITRADIPWTPSLSAFDRDAKWSTHFDRIIAADKAKISPRELLLEGGRKITWLSVLDVPCPICKASINSDCILT